MVDSFWKLRTNRANLSHPNIYIDGALSIHGVDNIIDQAFASLSCAMHQNIPHTWASDVPTSTTPLVPFIVPLPRSATRFLQNNRLIDLKIPRS